MKGIGWGGKEAGGDGGQARREAAAWRAGNI